MCCPKRITSHQLQCMHRSIVQFQCLMMRTTMRMTNHTMITSLLVLMPCKISLQFQWSRWIWQPQEMTLPWRRLAHYHTQKKVWTLIMTFYRMKWAPKKVNSSLKVCLPSLFYA
uniref:Uncharacterized protein n=1 Tax=Arundo donax TaxID=35708 RepID=A0A0A9EPJ2_ARUDO